MKASRLRWILLVTALLVSSSSPSTAQVTAVGVTNQAPRFVRLSADASREATVLNPAENAVLSRRISINLLDETRGASLQKVGIAANVQFVYASDLLPRTGSVRLQSASITVAAALVEVLAGAGVDIAVGPNDALILVRKPAASTQAFRGTLHTTAGGTPVVAAIVTLVDTLRSIQARTRSDEQGRFVLRTTESGLVRLRIQRIGVRPYESLAFFFHTDTSAVIALDELPAVALPRVASMAASACHDRSVEAEGTWELWEDVRTALLAAAITYSEQRSRFSLAEVRRIYDTQPRTLRDIALLEQTVSAAQPWTSLPPDVLAQRGYVRFADDRLTFVSPDLDVMLSRSFENTHCFLPTLMRDGPLLGLSFEPARSLKNHTDIAGTFWVDPASRELQRLTFHHTGLPFVMDDSTGESTVTFAKLDAQDWFIPSWTIRAPIPALMSSRAMRVEDQLRIFGGQVEGLDSRPFLWRSGGVNEQRGDVLAVYRASGSADSADSAALWTASTSALRVRVTAGTNVKGPRSPLEGAEVLLIGSSRQRMSDERGLAEFDRLTSGEYKIAVNTPINTLLVEPPVMTVVRVAPSSVATTEIVLRTPDEIIRQRCGTNRHVIVGTVTRDGAPVADAQFAVYDLSHGASVLVERVYGTFRRSNAEGRFVICARPTDTSSRLEIRVRGPAGEEASKTVQFTPETRIEAVEVFLPSRT